MAARSARPRDRQYRERRHFGRALSEKCNRQPNCDSLLRKRFRNSIPTGVSRPDAGLRRGSVTARHGPPGSAPTSEKSQEPRAILQRIDEEGSSHVRRRTWMGACGPPRGAIGRRSAAVGADVKQAVAEVGAAGLARPGVILRPHACEWPRWVPPVSLRPGSPWGHACGRVAEVGAARVAPPPVTLGAMPASGWPTSVPPVSLCAGSPWGSMPASGVADVGAAGFASCPVTPGPCRRVGGRRECCLSRPVPGHRRGHAGEWVAGLSAAAACSSSPVTRGSRRSWR